MSDELDLDQFEDSSPSETPSEAPKEELSPSTPRRGGRPPKWPTQMTLAQQRRARKLGMTPEQVARRVASGHPLDDLIPPRSLSSTERNSPDDPKFNYSKSEVSLYIAKVVIGSQMDWDSAAHNLRPTLSRWDTLQLALELENNEHVQLALTSLLRQMGIDEDSRSTFIKQVWQWFYSPNEQLALQASRILAKIFFGDKPADQAPPALKIEGFTEGLARLQGGPETPDPSPSIGQPENEEIVLLQTDADVLMPGRHE